MGDLISLALVAFFLMLGLVVGRARERAHFQSLDERENATRDFLVAQVRSFPGGAAGDPGPRLFVGEVVIATDYLKTFLSNLRKLVGGEMRSFQSLLVRARREAALRVVEQARAEGYDAICNLRYDSADIGGNATRKATGMVAIICSATAYRTRSDPV